MFCGGIVVLSFIGFVPWTTIASSSSTVRNAGHHFANLAEDDTASSSPELVRISYQDLQDVFGGNVDEQPPPNSSRKRNDLIQSIGQAFGLQGLGIIEVTNMPSEMVELRQKLLPYARHLANLPQEQLQQIEVPEQYYSIGWSHGREQLSNGEYDLSKGSFYIDPFRNPSAPTSSTNEKSDVDSDGTNGNGTTNNNGSGIVNVYPQALQPELEDMLLQMTHFMAHVGEWILKLCDAYLLQQPRQGQEQAQIYDDAPHHQKSLVDTLGSNINSKARLLHYFPKPTSKNAETTPSTSGDWCGWHTDHGSLTALLPGMVTNEETGLEEACPAVPATREEVTSEGDYEFPPGLYIRPRQHPQPASSAAAAAAPTTATVNDNGNLVHVQLAPTSLGFQIGETISIMSNGLLQATPHAVLSGRPRRGVKNKDSQNTTAPKVLSRQSLALFLQPSPGEPLPPLPTGHQAHTHSSQADPKSLEARWRPTFGEFHHATMKAYN